MRKHLVRHSLLFVTASLLAASLSITASPATSQASQARTTDFGVRGGLYPDADQPFVGAEALFNVGTNKRWFGNPNVEHAFNGDGDRTSLSFDFHYDFNTGHPYAFWAGAGPSVIFRDRDSGPDKGSETNAGVNLVLGVGARRGKTRPYGQLKVVFTAESQAVLGVGIRF